MLSISLYSKGNVELYFGINMELLCIGLSLKQMFYHSCWSTIVFTEMFFPTANILISVEQKIKCCVLIYFVQIYKTSDGSLIQLDMHSSF